MKSAEQRRAYYHRNREKCLEWHRDSYRRNKEQILAYNRDYNERLKRGEIQLPPLDWAICARGGSSAQARAHYRRGEKPCDNCRRASAAYVRARKALRKQQRGAA